jgi:hypothetical protein
MKKLTMAVVIAVIIAVIVIAIASYALFNPQTSNQPTLTPISTILTPTPTIKTYN